MANTSHSFAAFVGGAIVGGLVALLLAPKTGKELREELANRAEDLANSCHCDNCHCGEDEQA